MTRRKQNIEVSDSDRLWEAMLHLYPHIINKSGQEQPQGCAHLCREFAEALLTEWKGIRIPYDSTDLPVQRQIPPTDQAAG